MPCRGTLRLVTSRLRPSSRLRKSIGRGYSSWLFLVLGSTPPHPSHHIDTPLCSPPLGLVRLFRHHSPPFSTASFCCTLAGYPTTPILPLSWHLNARSLLSPPRLPRSHPRLSLIMVLHCLLGLCQRLGLHVILRRALAVRARVSCYLAGPSLRTLFLLLVLAGFGLSGILSSLLRRIYFVQI
jgi:hypothetical protein